MRKKKKPDKKPDEPDEPDEPLFIADFIGDALSNEKFCDVEFIVGPSDEKDDNNRKTFKAHKLILASHSPLFDYMLYGPLSKPLEAGERLQVRINDIKPDTFEALLKAIYTDKIDVNDSNLEEMTVVGKKYQIVKIQLACSNYMQRRMSIKNCCQMFEAASRLLGDDNFGISFIRENIDDICRTDGFLKLSKSRLELLLLDDKLAADEATLFQALQKWGKAECKRQNIQSNNEGVKAVLKDLLQYIRFPTMEIEQIATIVGPSRLLPEENLLLLYQYLSIFGREDNDKESTNKKKSTNEKEMYLAQIEVEKKVKEECEAKIKKLYNIKTRQGSFLFDKDSKLMHRHYKKTIFKFFNIKQGGRLVFKLLFRGSRDGFNAAAFHQKCDYKPKTFTIIKASNYKNIFGGYFEGEWAPIGNYVSQPSWLFSLVNAHSKPFKLLPSGSSSNVYLNSSYGPTWGGGHDLHVNSNMKSNSNYCSPSTFRLFAPGFENLGITIDNRCLAGSYNFSVEEIEVFQIVKITKVKK